MTSAPLAKRHIDDLALLGGAPAFPEVLHVGRPNIGDRPALMSRLERILDDHWLTNDGPVVRELEAKVAALLGVRHCIAMCNGTVALEIASRALGFSGEVIVPSFTFVATAHCLQWQEITPVFCDIEESSHTIDPGRLETLITPRTTGIIGVHLWGRPCAVEQLQEIARRHRLGLMFDAAHAFGCSHRGVMVGGFGSAEVLSFHATKFVTCGEGGAVVTNDDQLAEKMRRMRNFGFRGLDDVGWVGTNGKMSEFAGAVGISSLEVHEQVIAANRRNYERYRQGLSGLAGVRVLDFDECEASNYQYVVAEIDERCAGLSRDTLVDLLHAERIRARRYFWPGCHRMEPYRTMYPEAGRHLSVTDKVAARVLVLPTGECVSEVDVDVICQIVRLALDNAAPLRQKLSQRHR